MSMKSNEDLQLACNKQINPNQLICPLQFVVPQQEIKSNNEQIIQESQEIDQLSLQQNFIKLKLQKNLGDQCEFFINKQSNIQNIKQTEQNGDLIKLKQSLQGLISNEQTQVDQQMEKRRSYSENIKIFSNLNKDAVQDEIMSQAVYQGTTNEKHNLTEKKLAYFKLQTDEKIIEDSFCQQKFKFSDELKFGSKLFEVAHQTLSQYLEDQDKITPDNQKNLDTESEGALRKLSLKKQKAVLRRENLESLEQSFRQSNRHRLNNSDDDFLGLSSEKQQIKDVVDNLTDNSSELMSQDSPQEQEQKNELLVIKSKQGSRRKQKLNVLPPRKLFANRPFLDFGQNEF